MLRLRVVVCGGDQSRGKKEEFFFKFLKEALKILSVNWEPTLLLRVSAEDHAGAAKSDDRLAERVMGQ